MGNLAAVAGGGARAVMKIVLRFSENLGQGPAMVRVPSAGVIDIGWLWTKPPEGLKEEDMSPDLTVQVRFLNVTENNAGVNTTVFYGPYLPDAAQKKAICQDTLELLSIEAKKEAEIK